MNPEYENRLIGSVLAASTDPMLLVAPDLRILAANSECVDELGVPATDEGELQADPYLRPQRPLVDFQDLFADCLKGEQQHYEGWFELPGRGASYREVRLSPFIGAGDAVDGVLAVSRDKTVTRASEKALRHAEDRYRDLYENAPIGLTQVTPEGVLLNANEAFARMCGYHSAEALLQDASYAAGSFLADKEDWRRLKLLSKSNRSSVGAEVLINRRDGVEKWVDVHLRVVRDEQGGLLCYDAFVIDADRRKNAEAAMKRAVQDAENASVAKGNFLANMSHEVRTPLSGIIGLTELTLDSELTGDQRKCLEMVLGSGRSLLNVLNDILDLSKIEAGRLEFAQVPFDIKAVAESCVEMFGQPARQKGLTLALDVQDDLPERVVGDPDRLRQVLANLLSNAVKFTSQGFVKLEIETEDTGPEGDERVRFAVRDTGCGIARDMQSKVFDTFVQANRSFEGCGGGSGLGLAICANLVEIMGGELTVRSTEGQGSVFSFDAVFPVPEAAPEQEHASGGQSVDAGLKILVVEDDDINADFLVRLLEKKGHAASRAANGADALVMLARNHYDLVIMDIQMPEMDGVEAANRIRSGTPGVDPAVPILALTAHAMRGDKEVFLAAGMDGYVPKPVNTEALFAAMAEVLGDETGRAASGY